MSMLQLAERMRELAGQLYAAEQMRSMGDDSGLARDLVGEMSLLLQRIEEIPL
jgi:hypothetical protein